MDTNERLMTVDDLAAFLGVPKQSIYRWRMRRQGPPAYRVGKHLRFDYGAVRAWLEETTSDLGQEHGQR